MARSVSPSVYLMVSDVTTCDKTFLLCIYIMILELFKYWRQQRYTDEAMVW